MSSKIVLGTAQFGLDYGITNEQGVVSDDQMEAIIDLCFEQGTLLLDTAPAYGLSEKRLGRNSKVMDGDIQVITKTQFEGEIADVGRLITNVEASIKRLGGNTLHGLLIHDPNAFMYRNRENYLELLSYVKEKGLAKNVGISIYKRSQIDFIDVLKAIDFVQLPFSLFDQRMKTDGFLGKLKEFDIEIHARSVFLQGLLLSNDVSSLPSIKPYHKKFVEAIDLLSLSKVEAAIKFVDNIKEIDKIVVGATSVEQMREILLAFSKEVDTSQWGDLAVDNPKLVDPTQW
ncbi:aldo/keto reductase [Vibrio hepatarius]|uniref:aldo/keto reductase n=1 Tax=Vibrio hepatarius TaxID=171383 RepID=UPI00142DCBFC|nr:aldo/keto reductase [Vibrio hepatarius]NIY83315.1 aldo/keto reductase [Vibrio hepatarius]